jgi:pimeloyl-ACP methyl ester carboxylesterase
MSKTDDPTSGASGMAERPAEELLGSEVREGYAAIGDQRLHYVEAGEGPLIVLLHGFPEFWYGWRQQILPLAAAGFRVVAPDTRGYNLSSKPKGVKAYDAGLLAADIQGLIHERGAKTAMLVGHDWGGTIAWATAMNHPEVVDRLAILNAAHPRKLSQGLVHPSQLRKSWYFFFFDLPDLPEAVVHADRWHFFRHFLHDAHPAYTPEEMDRYVTVQRSADDGKTWERSKKIGLPESSGLTVNAVWHIEPGLPQQPGTLYLGADPGMLFRSDDAGETWEPNRGILEHPTRDRWFPGAGGLCCDSIQLDPGDPQRMYVCIASAGTLRSDDGGRTWLPFNKNVAADRPERPGYGLRHPGKEPRVSLHSERSACRLPHAGQRAGLPDLLVRGLPVDSARELLASAISGPLDDRVRARILAEAHGNPLALLSCRVKCPR